MSEIKVCDFCGIDENKLRETRNEKEKTINILFYRISNVNLPYHTDACFKCINKMKLK